MGGNLAYFTMFAARPQAVGYGMADSPAALAAWVLVHPGFAKGNYGADPARSPSRDDVLDDITLYWLTNTGTSAERRYWENGGRGGTSSAAGEKNQETGPP